MGSHPAMGPGEVRLRWVACDGVTEAQLARLRPILSADERERADRFHAARDRAVYTVAHALTRRMLAGPDVGEAPSVPFRRDAWGKPEIDRPGDRLRFSLTHTRGLAACAVARDAAVGLDAEAPDAGGDLLAVAASAFAPAEVAALRALPPADRRPAFLRLWTLKEAFLKAVGRGLSLPLADAVFTLEPFSFACAAGHGLDAGAWAFAELVLGEGCPAAVALHRPGGGGVSVDHRATDPDRLAEAPDP